MIRIGDKEGFAAGLEKEYLGRGFGSMNKNELEVLFFHLLKRCSEDFKGKSNFQLACLLRIPESRVKRLAYEAEMSYGILGEEEKKELQNKFLQLLDGAKIQNEQGTLRFAVEDKFLRSVIYEDLKQQGYYLDSSFNSEIVSIRKDALIALLDSYYREEDKAAIIDSYKSTLIKIGKKEDGVITFKRVMGVVFDKCLETGTGMLIEGLGKIDYQSLIKTISGGIKAIGFLVKIIAGVATIL